MAELALALAVSARPWADRLHRHTMDHGGARVRVRILDGRQATDQDYDVLFVDDTTSFLDSRLVQELRAQGKGVIGVADGPQMEEAQEWLGRLGIEVVLPAAAPARLFLEAAADARRSVPAVVEQGPARATAEPANLLVSVMGCSGGVGATEVAIGSARAWPGEVVLADLDLASPSLAQRLGLALLPNLRSALHARRKVVDLLEAELHGYSDGVRVLPGLPSSVGDRLHSHELTGLVRDLRGFGDVVVNLPAGMPDPEGPHDAPMRTAAAVLEESDLATVVTVATPIGIRRMFEWAFLAATCGIDHPTVVINHAPRSAYAKAEIRAEVERVLEPSSVQFLPADDRVRRAAWDGTVVRRGPFVRALGRAVGEWTSR